MSIRASIEEHFSELKYPRIDRSKELKLIGILIIAICGAICGADTWEDMADFGRAKQEWFEQFLELPNGIPSHITFIRVFNRLDLQQFQGCFVNWVTAASELIEGQVLRRSHDRGIGKAAIDMVSAWAIANHLVLGQINVDDKSNEITAIPQLLKVLEIAGCIITIDAIGCQTEIAAKIVDRDADYVLALKENQGCLYEDTKLVFGDLEKSDYTAYTHDYARTITKGHGRIETRECWTISDPEVQRSLSIPYIWWHFVLQAHIWGHQLSKACNLYRASTQFARPVARRR